MRKRYGINSLQRVIQLTRLIFLLSMMILSFSGVDICVAADSPPRANNHWFYMVKTMPSDPSREVEFNAWYDEVDIPDVLEVPGFMRARRAVAQTIPEFPLANLKSDDGNYVALYDIETNDIDKSIIDLYVAARKMGALGRLTDVLKVVEANYYHRVAPQFEVSIRKSAGKYQYIYVKKILCCHDAATRGRFQEWYARTLIPEVEQVKGLVRVNLYELYRIMEVLTVGPEEIPHLLAVYEIEADSPKEAIDDIYKVVEKLNETDRMNHRYLKGGLAVYLQMSDVKAK